MSELTMMKLSILNSKPTDTQLSMKRQLYSFLQGKLDNSNVTSMQLKVNSCNVSDVLDKLFQFLFRRSPAIGSYIVVTDDIGRLFGIIQRLTEAYMYLIPHEYVGGNGALQPFELEEIDSWIWNNKDMIRYKGKITWKRRGTPSMVGITEQVSRKRTFDEWSKREFGE